MTGLRGDIRNNEKQVLVIGVGNAYRSDDAVGLIAARRIEEKGFPNVRVVKESGEGTALIELWKDADAVIMFDSVQSDAAPGSIHRFEPGAQPVPQDYFRYSTHLFGVGEAIELARVLKRLPPRLVVYGIRGKNLSMGIGLSPEVEEAVPEIVERAVRDIAAIGTAKQTH